jgi:cobalt/nickel transport system permease protein
MRLSPEHVSPAESRLSRLDPRWKLAALLLAALMIACLRSLPAAALGLAGALGLALFGRVPFSWFVSRLGSLAAFLALMALFLPVQTAVLLYLKGVAILAVMLVMIASAPLHDTFKAAHALRIPGLLVQLAMLTYRYIFILASELGRLRIALRVRGYRNRASRHSYRTIGHVAGTLLVRGYERAERVGQAMRCRGFDGRLRSLAEFRTQTADLSFFLMVVSLSGGLLAWDFFQR